MSDRIRHHCRELIKRLPDEALRELHDSLLEMLKHHEDVQRYHETGAPEPLKMAERREAREYAWRREMVAP